MSAKSGSILAQLFMKQTDSQTGILDWPMAVLVRTTHSEKLLESLALFLKEKVLRVVGLDALFVRDVVSLLPTLKSIRAHPSHDLVNGCEGREKEVLTI